MSAGVERGDRFPARRMGRPRRDDRQMLNVILWILRSVAKWRGLRDHYGPGKWSARAANKCDDGTFESLLAPAASEAASGLLCGPGHLDDRCQYDPRASRALMLGRKSLPRRTARSCARQ
ncbi:transposase [Pseudomonas sp. BAV 4579]|uniref:transposase n=2 Tax=unclassified Pseudomonas TaxID=196821 RepID=UPI003557E7AB